MRCGHIKQRNSKCISNIKYKGKLFKALQIENSSKNTEYICFSVKWIDYVHLFKKLALSKFKCQLEVYFKQTDFERLNVIEWAMLYYHNTVLIQGKWNSRLKQ